MLVGHIAVAMASKRIAPKLTLGTLVLAAVLADLLWGIFLLAGIEHISLKPGRGAFNYLDAVDAPFSHSLAMDALWAGLLAGAALLWRRRLCPAAVLFAAGLSHWLLDYASHAPDMPLAPGAGGRYGLGLWSSIPATLIVEGGLWLIAIILYVRATRSKRRAGLFGFWVGIAVWTLVWWNNIAGPPPANIRAAGIGSLILFATIVGWAYWMDRVRLSENSENTHLDKDAVGSLC